MRTPRPLTGAALAALTVAALGTGPAAFADPVSDLYVTHVTGCDDAGPGTRAVPFCTVQAAADAVEPGQTVHIGPAPDYDYEQPVVVARSGTPSAPITFTGEPDAPLRAPNGRVPLTLEGVHDVHLDALDVIGNAADAVDVTGSRDVVLDRLRVSAADPDVTSFDGVRLDGASSGVTLSRSTVYDVSGYAVHAEPGAHDVTVTTDGLAAAQRGGVLADGTTGADVVSDTVQAVCGPGVTMQNGASGVVENDVLVSVSAGETADCPSPANGIVTVDAASAGGVTADYDTFGDPLGGAVRPAYAWAGTAYATPADRTAATGAGAHDGCTATEPPVDRAPGPAGGVIDSADADAPGELTTDIDGRPHTDDPEVADSGTGSVGYADRGAYESQDPITFPAGDPPPRAEGTTPFTTSVAVGDATSGWHEDLTYSVDFGDGTDPVPATAATPARHTYTTPGAYRVTVTATDTDGTSAVSLRGVVAATAGAVPATLTATRDSAPQPATGQVDFGTPMTDAFQIASRTLDFGDGQTQDVTAYPSVGHLYSRAGDYTAKLTTTDVLGRTTKATATFRVTATTAQVPYYGDQEPTIPAHGTVTFRASQLGGISAAAYELRVNVVSSKDGGWITAYPAGTTRPSASTLNFPAGGGSSNQETVTGGTSGGVTFYNGADSPARVTIRTTGRVVTDAPGDSYHPTNPVTLLNTRYGTGGVTGPVGAGRSVTVPIAGANGVPANADAVTLDVAENTTQASGSLTVAPHGGTSSDPVTASYWRTGESVTNLVTLPLVDGKVTLTNDSTGSANLVAALAGWFTPDTSGSGAWPVTPVRVLDTQTGLGETGGKALELAAHGTLKVKVAGTAGLPASGLTAADLNLTVSAPAASGWLVAYPDGATRPTAGAVNYTQGHTIAGQAVIKVGGDGYVDLYNPTATAVDVFADIHGGYVPMN